MGYMYVSMTLYLA